AVPTSETRPVWTQPRPAGPAADPTEPADAVPAEKGDPDWSKTEASNNGDGADKPPEWAQTVPTDPGESIPEAVTSEPPGADAAGVEETEPPEAQLQADEPMVTEPPEVEAEATEPPAVEAEAAEPPGVEAEVTVALITEPPHLLAGPSASRTHAGAHQASRATGAADPDCGPRARPTRRASAAWTAFASGVGAEGTGRARWTRPASGQVALGNQRAGLGAAGAPGR